MPINALPLFSQFQADDFADRLQILLDGHLARIQELLAQQGAQTWDSLMRPLEDMEDALEQFFAPLGHLHAVVNSKALRECYEACLPKLSAYEAAIGHNQALYNAIAAIDTSSLNPVQTKILEDTLRDFRLSGVALTEDKKARFEQIQQRLAELSHQFENHLLDATQAYDFFLEDASRLEGLPPHALQEAQQLAKAKGKTGYLLNLETPCYLAIMTHAKDRELREQFYQAHVTRASEIGPTAAQYDNGPVMDEILSLRHEKALLLGYSNYAELSLATKMAESTSAVIDFLGDLALRSRAQGLREMEQLRYFAKSELGIDQLAPWDIAFASEQKRQADFDIAEEALRPYFPLPKVLQGLFEIVEILYGVRLKAVQEFDSWHADVSCYELLDEKNSSLGFLYMDLFARTNKRGGAWMDSARSRRRLADGGIQTPIAFLTCNFAKALQGKPATLSHEELETLFHEFGHCLHHLLTKVEYLAASGIHGVEWDAVELPSQFFENWTWEFEALAKISGHVDTGTPLAKAEFDKLRLAKHFQSAMAMLRQLEFALFDFRIHMADPKDNTNFIANTLNAVRTEVSVLPLVPYNRFQHGFSHIFAGGYGAGYYSYKWAELLSQDAYARFKEEGIFNPQTGRDFLTAILEVGGSRKAIDAFIAFRKRAPQIEALLEDQGIEA